MKLLVVLYFCGAKNLINNKLLHSLCVEIEQRNKNIDVSEFNSELSNLFDSVRFNQSQKRLIEDNFQDLKETFLVQREYDFNQKYKSIKGLGRSTKKALVILFNEEFNEETY